MLPDKTPTEPSKFITTLMLQFHDANMNQIYQEGSIFETTHLLPDFKNVTLTTPVKLSSINDLNISYTDLVGNIYNLFWQKP
jgi:ubiquitin C-terminal hydrolase